MSHQYRHKPPIIKLASKSIRSDKSDSLSNQWRRENSLKRQWCRVPRWSLSGDVPYFHEFTRLLCQKALLPRSELHYSWVAA